MKIYRLPAWALISVALSGCAKTAPTPAPVPLPSFEPPASSASPELIRKSSVSNLKQLGLAILTYSQKHDDALPDLSSPDAMRADVYPFLESGGAKLFIHPSTGEPYTPNPSLSKVKFDDIKDPTSQIILFEASPDGNLTRACLFADGHVKRMDEDDFQKIKPVSKIP